MCNWSPVIDSALERLNGARYYRCSLQVNTFEYLKRHIKETQFVDEDSYNAAILDALEQHGIEVIAITDHYRVKTGVRLADAARDRGIHVFNGFEAVTKDGIHVLCLFDPSDDIDKIDRFIGDCGIHDDGELSPTGSKDFEELLDACTEDWNGIAVAAHVCSGGGLLHTLRGQTTIKAWTHNHLYACALAGPIEDAPNNQRPILENKNPEYKRKHPIAVINAQDVSCPEDVSAPGASCWIKMASVSIEGLRQAFLDPESRVRLITDDEPEDRTELKAIAWEGGFLDGISINFNENLNVLIGGRGTGKSTVIESIRFALDCKPLGEDACKQHDAFVSQVLKGGTKVSLLVRSHSPSPREYLIERTVSGDLLVKDCEGTFTSLGPKDICSEVEIFGQHEISELARSPRRLTELVERLSDRSEIDLEARRKIKHELEDTRKQIIELEKSLERIECDLADLPRFRETRKRFDELGLDKRLKDKTDLVSEEGVLNSLDDIVSKVVLIRKQFDSCFPINLALLEDERIKSLGGADIVRKARPILKKFSADLDGALSAFDSAVKNVRSGLESVRTEWNQRRERVNDSHSKILRELQKEGIDGNEYTRLIKRIEKLEPRIEEKASLEGQLKETHEKRRGVLEKWETLQINEFQALEKTAKRINRKLDNSVRLKLIDKGNREELERYIGSLPGRIFETRKALTTISSLSVGKLAQVCRQGEEALVEQYGIPAGQAETLATAGADFILGLEELELLPTTIVELNVAREGVKPNWKPLDSLSTGQKATAILLLLLLESRGPLIIDQPEDDLDNRFITESIVPRIKFEKRRRQFIFTTHNANLPVLGDAELIAALVPIDDAEEGEVSLPDENIGSIDTKKVRELIEDTLEGGKLAFELRRLKYGF